MISMLFTKRIYFINEIWIFLILTIHTAKCLQISHGRSASNVVKLISIAGIPLRQCIDECSARPRCTFSLYHVATHVCLLGSNHVSGEDIVRKPGHVLVYGFNKTFPVLCDGTECEQTETCLQTGSSSLCQITECGPPSGFDTMYGALRGNMYNIDSKLLVNDSCRHSFTFVCGQNGQWSRDLSTLEFATCPGCVGCSTADTGVSFTIHENLIGGLNDKMAFCDFKTDGGNWLVFQRRQDGSEDFYRGWDDYVTGFGDPCGEFWLGLKALHLILNSTDDTFELRIDLEDFEGDKRYAHYSSVNVTGPEDNYRLHLGTYSGTAGDALTAKGNGMMFSTYDSDNDVSGGNCAQSFKGGWWYCQCHDANLNGLYLRGEYEPYAIGVTWKQFRGQHYSMKHTEMKIRKLNY